MSVSLRAALETLEKFGINARNFRDEQAILHAAKVARAVYRAKCGV